MNKEEQDSAKDSENEGNGLLRKRKRSVTLEPRENVPAETGHRPFARRASFPAIGTCEVTSTLSGTIARSCPDNWIRSLLSDLPSIEKVPDEDRMETQSLSREVAKQAKHPSKLKTCTRSFTAPMHKTPRPVNQNTRGFNPAKFSNSSRKASTSKNYPKEDQVVTNKSTNWKIRVNKRTIIDDDDTSTHSSQSGLLPGSTSWSDDSTCWFPRLNLQSRNIPFSLLIKTMNQKRLISLPRKL